MAADFQILDNDELDHTSLTSQATSVAITPAVGDLVFWGGNNSVGTSPTVTGGGMTWELEHLEADATANDFIAVFRAASGTPAEEVLTLGASDNWIDTTYVVVRPVELTYVGVAGNNNSAGSSVDTLTVTITSTTPAGLLAYFRDAAAHTWAEDTTNGFSEILDLNHASGNSHQLQEKFGDADEVVGNASANAPIQGVVLEFSAAGGAVPAPPGGRGTSRAVRRAFGRGLHRSMTKLGNLWLPTGPHILPAGAR